MKTAMDRLVERCAALDFEAMTPAAFCEFVETLPEAEFPALVSMFDEYRRPGARSPHIAAAETVDAVTDIEGHVLRLIDEIAGDGEITVDARWLSIGKTAIQQGFMAVVRSVANPEAP